MRKEGKYKYIYIYISWYRIGINFVEGKENRLGYLANIKSHSYQEDESTTRYACLLLHFVMQDALL